MEMCDMPMKPFTTATTLPVWVHAACATGTVGFFQWIKGRLDAGYAASGHPVDYFTGQTAFSGPVVKEYYGHMQDAGTLDIYVRTQMIDFGFILAMIGIGVFVFTLLARAGRAGSFSRRVGLLAGLSIVTGALCDAIENGISFIMLANPAGFADWLALPYSTFASVKFALITLGMALILLSLVTALSGRLLRRPALG